MLSVNFGSLEGISGVVSLLAAALVLTLMEEVVFRVTIQERLSWFVGTPAAILFAAVIFGFGSCCRSVREFAGYPHRRCDVIVQSMFSRVRTVGTTRMRN